jgi:hypothetical protein
MITPRIAVTSDFARHLPEAKVTSEFTRHPAETKQGPQTGYPAKQDRAPQAGYPGNLPYLYSPGMDQAVELAKTACANTVWLNSCFMNMCKHFFWYPIGLGYWFEGQNQACALWMDLATQWFGVLTPQGVRAPAAPMPAFSKHPEPTRAPMPVKTFPRIEPAVEEKIEKKIEADIEGKIEREVEKKIEAEMEGKIEKEIEQKIESDVEGKIEKELEERIKAEIEEEIEEIEHGMDVAVEAFEEGVLA